MTTSVGAASGDAVSAGTVSVDADSVDADSVDADSVDGARSEYERGAALSRQGRPVAARAHLDAALAALRRARGTDGAGTHGAGADELLARCLISLSYVEYEIDGLPAALARLDEAEAVARGVASARLLLHMQRGVLAMRLGRFHVALDHFDFADRFRSAAPPADRPPLLLNRGFVHLDLGQVRAARADLTRCLEEARAIGLDRLVLKATHNLGWVEFTAGDLPRALALMDSAFAMDDQMHPGRALLGKAQVLAEAGLHAAAEDTLVQASESFLALQLPQDLGEAELERARCALALGDPATAGRLATSARTRFVQQSADEWRRKAELVALHAELADGTVTDATVAAAGRLQREWTEAGMTTPARSAALARVEALVALDRPAQAADLLAGLGPSRRTDPVSERLHAHVVHAQVAAATGRAGPAADRVRRALAELARYQAGFGSLDLRTASAVHGRRIADLGVELALRTGRPAAVYAAAERARAASSRLTPVRPPEDEHAAALLAELRRTVEALREVEQDRGAAAPLLVRRRELEQRIRARSWALPGGGRPASTAPLGDVRRRLAEVDRTMLVLLGSRSRLYAVSVGARVAVHELGPTAAVVDALLRLRADLDVSARPHLPPALRAAVRGSLTRAVGRIDAALAPALGAVRRGGLVVVTTGALSGLPWGLLPSLRGVPVTVAPSATKWLACSEPSLTRRPRVVTVAGPDVARGDAEAAEVAASWRGARVLTGADATVGSFTGAVGECDVLHVAAHGFHQSDSPLFSSLRMADGSVFAHDLTASPAHVVLSACQVGLASVRPGDETLGLASALLHLGARSVIAGVALVGDDVAARTMITYHRRLASGVPSDVALAATLAEVDDGAVPPFVELGAAWTATPTG